MEAQSQVAGKLAGKVGVPIETGAPAPTVMVRPWPTAKEYGGTAPNAPAPPSHTEKVRVSNGRNWHNGFPSHGWQTGTMAELGSVGQQLTWLQTQVMTELRVTTELVTRLMTLADCSKLKNAWIRAVISGVKPQDAVQKLGFKARISS